MIGSCGIFWKTHFWRWGLPRFLVSVIMNYVSSASFQILWNGSITESFCPMCGLRQGDPLSPYLFVLCMERLRHLIDEAVGCGCWSPIFLSRGVPVLSRLFFADDLILFYEANLTQVS